MWWMPCVIAAARSRCSDAVLKMCCERARAALRTFLRSRTSMQSIASSLQLSLGRRAPRSLKSRGRRSVALGIVRQRTSKTRGLCERSARSPWPLPPRAGVSVAQEQSQVASSAPAPVWAALATAGQPKSSQPGSSLSQPNTRQRRHRRTRSGNDKNAGAAPPALRERPAGPLAPDVALVTVRI